jgi:hypothetical protein
MKVTIKIDLLDYENLGADDKVAELSGELVDVITSMREFLNATVQDQVEMAREIVQLKKRLAELEASHKQTKTKVAFL